MPEQAIKSVRRVFEIFELFDKERRPLSAKEVADELGYPLASSHALMKSMHQLEYLDFDAPKWTYIPSRNFSALSLWVSDFLDRETQLLKCIEDLNHETRETVNISRLVGSEVKIIHGFECKHPVGVSVKVGTLMPATQSLTGTTALAALSDAELSRFIERLDRADSDAAGKADLGLIDAVKSELASRGTVSRCDLFIQGIGAVCLPVRTNYSKETMVIGVVGPSDRIALNQEDHRHTLERILKEHNIDCLFRLSNPRKVADRAAS